LQQSAKNEAVSFSENAPERNKQGFREKNKIKKTAYQRFLFFTK
jgi:hypothetical protein